MLGHKRLQRAPGTPEASPGSPRMEWSGSVRSWGWRERHALVYLSSALPSIISP